MPVLEVAGYLLLSILVFGLLLPARWVRRTSILTSLLLWVAQFAVGVGIGAAIILLALLVPLLMGHYSVGFLASPGAQGAGSSPAFSSPLNPSQALAMLSMQSLREEAFFRGCWMLALVLLLGLLSRAILGRRAFLSVQFQLILWGNVVLLSSALFTLQHTDNPHIGGAALFNILLAGLLFGLLFAATRSLTLIWGLHFAWNSMLVLLGLPVSGYRVALHKYLITLTARTGGLATGGAFGPEAGLGLTVVLVVALGMVARALPRRMKGWLAASETRQCAEPPAESEPSGDE